MIGWYASAETNLILRDRRIINRRNPQPATPQLVTQPIHSFTVADHDRHDVGCRSSGIDSELAQFFMEIMRVLPKPRPQFGLLSSNLERFENRGHDNRRQRARVNIWVRIKSEVTQRFLRPGDKSAERAKSF